MPIDHLVITAANRAQARGYEAQLRDRADRGLLPDVHHHMVVPDAGDRRIGSGASTLDVLYQVAQQRLTSQPDAASLEALFHGARIQIVHSGGDSKRLVAYAAQGKAFAPLPCRVPTPGDRADGSAPAPTADAAATLFDLILNQLRRLPAPAAGHTLIAAGDVLLTFDPNAVDLDRPGVTGVAYPGEVARGSAHGVYVADRHGRVTNFLQKPDEPTARKHHAIDGVGRVLIDTGLVSLDPDTVGQWLEAAGATLRQGKLTLKPGLLQDIRDGHAPMLDLYEHVLMALLPRTTDKSYLRRIGAEHQSAKQAKPYARVLDALRGPRLGVCVLPWCDFFHIGTSRELITNVRGLGRTASRFGFKHLTRSHVADGVSIDDAFVFNSVLDHPDTRVGPGSYAESTHSTAPLELDGQNILVGLPGDATSPIHLPERFGLVCIPVKTRGKSDQWAAVVFGIDDAFKGTIDDGATFGNLPLTDRLDALQLTASSLFKGLAAERRTLWDARLWRVGPLEQAINASLWMTQPTASPPAGWTQAKRLSLAQMIPKVDHHRLLHTQHEAQRIATLHHAAELLTDPDQPTLALRPGLVRSTDEARVALRSAKATLKTINDPVTRARLLMWMHRLGEDFPKAKLTPARSLPRALDEAAFEAVRESVADQIALPTQPRRAAILPDQAVWATTPVRLDFAGGWSDTPPICSDIGGAVVNAAITLNGQYPVQAVAKLSEQKTITLSSIDLSARVTIRQTQDLMDYRDPSHWAALPKAALVLSGIAPSHARASLPHWLDTLGGGLDITLFSALPKGSGLGTSSVLGAAVLACLARVVGEPIDTDTLIARTSLLEQLMTTGGGWQDQVGGITRGVKLIRTQPGPDQTPDLRFAVFDRAPDSDFRQRLLLYFTGQKRMAKNILQNVVTRYLAGEENTHRVVHEIKQSADTMKHALDARDTDAFAQGIEHYWSQKKAIDPGSTNPRIEAMLQPLAPLLSGKVLPGAGGGGFVFMVAKSIDAAHQLRATLQAKPPNPHARFFDFDIDPQGLKVTVL